MSWVDNYRARVAADPDGGLKPLEKLTSHEVRSIKAYHKRQKGEAAGFKRSEGVSDVEKLTTQNVLDLQRLRSKFIKQAGMFQKEGRPGHYAEMVRLHSEITDKESTAIDLLVESTDISKVRLSLAKLEQQKHCRGSDRRAHQEEIDDKNKKIKNAVSEFAKIAAEQYGRLVSLGRDAIVIDEDPTAPEKLDCLTFKA